MLERHPSAARILGSGTLVRGEEEAWIMEERMNKRGERGEGPTYY